MSSNVATLPFKELSSIFEPKINISKDGYSFSIHDDKWMLNKDIIISFQSEILALDEKVLMGFRQTLATYAEELSAAHTQNMYLRMQNLVRDTGCIILDEIVLLYWRASLGDEREWYLGSLRGFLISWYDYGYFGVSSDMVKLLESLTISGNRKGVAVANRCPYSGAFTENEVLAINEELINLWRENEISFVCYSYICLVQATARRSINLRQLKACDITKEHDTQTNKTNFYVNIPRAKQRGIGFRGAFKKIVITEDLYLILINLIITQTKKLSSIFEIIITDNDKSLIPVFLDEEMAIKFANQRIEMDKQLLNSDALHLSSKDLAVKFIKSFTKKQKAISERTGDIIHISARRFRHTRGTNLGRKGIGARIIAEALDHSDSQNVKVYSENTADTVEYIDKAVGSQLAPFANAFMGRIIENLSDGERGDDPTAKIPNDENEAIGACGTNDFCVNGYEACYLCRKFRPLQDAPHEKVLESLYLEKEERFKKTGSEQYASTKDRLILAVEFVVQKCCEMNTKKDVGRA